MAAKNWLAPVQRLAHQFDQSAKVEPAKRPSGARATHPIIDVTFAQGTDTDLIRNFADRAYQAGVVSNTHTLYLPDKSKVSLFIKRGAKPQQLEDDMAGMHFATAEVAR